MQEFSGDAGIAEDAKPLLHVRAVTIGEERNAVLLFVKHTPLASAEAALVAGTGFRLDMAFAIQKDEAPSLTGRTRIQLGLDVWH